MDTQLLLYSACNIESVCSSSSHSPGHEP